MRRSTWRRLGRSVLVASLMAPATAAAQHFPPNGDLEIMLRYLVEDGVTPGVALGVLDPDGTTRAVAWGDAGPGSSRESAAVTPATAFELGALTMTLTATLLEEMVGRGEVSLDDPVARYLPDGVAVPSYDGRPITLVDLATHRSGLPASPSVADPSMEDLYADVSVHELDAPPGTRREFSTLGYALLGHALARAAGTEYGALLRERVLEPLGMRQTGYAPSGPGEAGPAGRGGSAGAAGAARAAVGHDDGRVVPPSSVPEALRGATGLRSTVLDLLAFVKAAAGPATTDLERAVERAWTVRYPRPARQGYGFSWRTYTVGGQPPIVVHGGGTAGFTSLVAFDPAQRIGTVLLANTRGFDDWIGRTLLFFDPPSTEVEADVEPEALRRWVGTYRSGSGNYRADFDQGRYFIRLEDEGYLTYQAQGVVRTRLYARSDSAFYMLRGPLTVTFSGDGEAAGLRIHVDEREPDARDRGWRAQRVDAETPPPRVVAGNAPRWALWGAGTWGLIGLAGLGALAGILRPIWSGWRGRSRPG